MNLTGRDLAEADLSGADLRGAILDEAELRGVRWNGATCPDGSNAGLDVSCADRLLAPGAAERPLALGQSTRLGDWTVTVTSYQADSESNARVVNYIGDEPGEGFVYAIVGFDVEYEGSGQNETPGGNLDFGINGLGYRSADTLCSLPIQDSGGSVDGLNAGQSTSYEECMYLPVETATTGFIRVYDGYSFEADSPSAYWTIP